MLTELSSQSRLRTMLANLSTTLGIVGERWALLVVREVSHRPAPVRRPPAGDRCAKGCAGRSAPPAGCGRDPVHPVLPGAGTPAAPPITLTDAGFDLVPLLAAISDWGERHLADGEQSDIDYRHASCGGKVSARLVCECGGN